MWKEGLWWFGGSSSSSCFGLTTERCRSVELPIPMVRRVDVIMIPRLIRSGHTDRAGLRTLICKLDIPALRRWKMIADLQMQQMNTFRELGRSGNSYRPFGIFGEQLGNAFSTWE